jgi:signal transduction histidine kinase
LSEPRVRKTNGVWRFLYRAQTALADAADVETLCATAARLAVPRLANACTVCSLDGTGDRTWRAGGAGPWDVGEPEAVPLVAGGRTVGTMRFHRAPDRQSACRSAAGRAYGRVVGRALGRLLKSDSVRAEFAAALAHELANAVAPLRWDAAIIGECEPGSPRGRAVCARLARQTERLAKILTGMLELARAEHGKLALQVRPVTLADVVGGAAESVGPLIEGRGHRLAVRIDAAVGEVWADPPRMEQVLTNLLANAAKYTPPGGDIELIAAREGGYVVIRVRDSGKGIEPRLLPRLFDCYSQADPGRGGLGLGLALVRRLVELHGGTVAAHSDGPGTGSEFVIRLTDRPRGS